MIGLREQLIAIWLYGAPADWLRRHGVGLLRLGAVVVLLVVAVVAGITCHGVMGPPG